MTEGRGFEKFFIDPDVEEGKPEYTQETHEEKEERERRELALEILKLVA